MKPRTLLLSTVAVIVVLFASLTTVRAYQYSAADAAHSRLLRVESATDRLLLAARTDGLTASEVSPLVHAERAILNRPEPAGLPFWRPGLASFYLGQQHALVHLNQRIDRTIVGVTLARRAQASRELRALRSTVSVARRLDVPATRAEAVLAAQSSSFAAARTARDYSAVIMNVAAAVAALRASYASEQRYVSQELSQVNGSLSAIRSRIRAEKASIDGKLSLLGLLTKRAVSYRHQAQMDTTAGLTATTAFEAAVKESHLHALQQVVATDYRKTVPNKMIVVSTETQYARVYQGGKVILTTPVTTGGPELPTDHGVFHIYMKATPWVFHSPWPPSSPYYYPPTPITYWMPFDGGEGLHDAWWRSNFGPGSNLQPTNLGTGNYILGTHGCVNLPFSAAQFIWNWAPVGTTVVVI